MKQRAVSIVCDVMAEREILIVRNTVCSSICRRGAVLILFGGALVATMSVRAGAQIFPLQTSGGFIVGADGERVKLNAVNWYGAESPDYVVGGLAYNRIQDIAQQIASVGFNAVRLPWSNEMYETNPIVPSYALGANPELMGLRAMDIFDQVVSTLAANGLMVILDDHSSDAEWCCGNDGNTLWYNSRYPESSWISDWQAMVERYIGQPYVIGVDLRNEPRINATWGGDATTDWHAAAERGGNAVLRVNANLLIFVEGVNYSLDLSGAGSLPIFLEVANQLVYSPHDYRFSHATVTSYDNWVGQINPQWGFLVTGSSPQPVWVGEFGTCNTADACVASTNTSDNGFWFDIMTRYVRYHSLDWSYWPVNGTQSSGSGRAYGARETYGILNTTWDDVSLPSLAGRLQEIMLAAPPVGPVADGIYQIVNRASGLVMDVTGQSTANGARIEQYPSSGGSNQLWNVHNLGYGLYQITSVGSGKSLDITGQSIAYGASVEQWDYWGGGNQQFIITATDCGSYEIMSVNSELPIEVPGSSSEPGTDLDQWGSNGGPNQQWLFEAP